MTDQSIDEDEEEEEEEKEEKNIRPDKIVPKGVLDILKERKFDMTSDMWYAYMLSWNLLVSVFGKVSISPRVKICVSIHVSESENLLEHVLELIVSQMMGKSPSPWPSRFPRFSLDSSNVLESGILPYPYDVDAAECLHRSTMMHTAARLPALFRSWWNARAFSSKRERVEMEKFISSKVSLCCVNSEMLNIAIGAKSKVWDTEQMSIRGSQIARQYVILSDRGVVAGNIDEL